MTCVNVNTVYRLVQYAKQRFTPFIIIIIFVAKVYMEIGAILPFQL